MAKTLNQLYFEATGNTITDVEALVVKLNKTGEGAMTDDEKNAVINRILWSLPGGASGVSVPFLAAFANAVNTLEDIDADVNKDDVVNAADIEAYKELETKTDINNDGDVDDEDIAFIETLVSTAEIVAETTPASTAADE
jgi:hypothetical protein